MAEHNPGEYGPPSWPVAQDANGFDVKRGKLKTIATSLEEDLVPVKGVGSGSVMHMEQYCNVSAEHVGQWDAAQDLHKVLADGYTAIHTGYAEFVTRCEGVIAAVRAGAGGYDQGEISNGGKEQA
ncbi:hypothetical protein [Streptosporangium sp. KLBMP 9127]|nr:hypothetical protein [Streptosporangium sp. KLBMP 9127]